jgi:hypothetical protein
MNADEHRYDEFPVCSCAHLWHFLNQTQALCSLRYFNGFYLNPY